MSKPIRKQRIKKTVPKFTLPDSPNEISANMMDYIWLIYGDRKIGKTTLLSEFEDIFFLMFDPLNKGLKIYQKHCKTWSDFLRYIDLLEENPDYCKMVCIDTGYMAYEKCYAHVCKELNIKDPRDKAWGNAWKQIAREFMDAHDRIMDLGLGLAITAHSDMKEVPKRDGTTEIKLTTQLGGQAFKYYNGLVDVIAYYAYDAEGKRNLYLKGDKLIEAGTRIQEHFMYPNGKRIAKISMGNSQQESYENLTKAFNNQLPNPVKKEVKKPVRKVQRIVRRK